VRAQWLHLLKTGHSLLSVELDVILLRDVKPYIPLEADLLTMYYNRTYPANSRNLGFVYLRASLPSVILLESRIPGVSRGEWDQGAFNNILNSKLLGNRTWLDERRLMFHDSGTPLPQWGVRWGEESSFTPLVDAIHAYGNYEDGVAASQFAAVHLIGVSASTRQRVFAAATLIDPGFPSESAGYLMQQISSFASQQSGTHGRHTIDFCISSLVEPHSCRSVYDLRRSWLVRNLQLVFTQCFGIISDGLPHNPRFERIHVSCCLSASLG
jgi:hypothetical protein